MGNHAFLIVGKRFGRCLGNIGIILVEIEVGILSPFSAALKKRDTLYFIFLLMASDVKGSRGQLCFSQRTASLIPSSVRLQLVELNFPTQLALLAGSALTGMTF